MSAWYVLASLGMYEVCPGSGIWIRTRPLFDTGLDWALASDPQGEGLVCPDLLRMTPCPVFDDWRMQSNRDRVSDTIAKREGRLPSQRVRHREVKSCSDMKVTYLTQPAPQYTENGPEGMVDGVHGTANYRIGGWQGWQGDMVAVVELDKVQKIGMIGLNCLENMRSWIFFPRRVVVEYSLDGEHWNGYGEVENTQFAAIHERQEESVVHQFGVRSNVRAKYIRITAKNYGPLPDWHVSAGEQAWVFADEIIVK